MRQADRFNGFNLLLGDSTQLVYTNNVDGRVEVLPPGVYTLSNALLDARWPKTQSAQNKLLDWLDQPGEIGQLAGLLSDRSLADDAHLPDTGVSSKLEKSLSAEFIDIEGYNTHCSTALIVDDQGTAGWLELTFKPQAETGDGVLKSFCLRVEG